MKQILTLITCLLFTGLAYGQTLNNIPIKDLDAQYIEIMGVRKGFTKKINVFVDYGQHVKLFENNKKLFVYEGDKKLEFNSMMDALNFFEKHGYEYVNSYAYSVGNSNVYHHLLKKRK